MAFDSQPSLRSSDSFEAALADGATNILTRRQFEFTPSPHKLNLEDGTPRLGRSWASPRSAKVTKRPSF
jgi:hypothetical protein